MNHYKIHLSLIIKYLVIVVLFFITPGIHAQSLKELSDNLQAQFRSWDFIGCIETCNQVQKSDPKNRNAYYYKGLSKFFLGDYNGALDDLSHTRKKGSIIQDKKKLTKYLLKYFYKGVKVYPELGMRPKYTRKDSLRGALRPERTCYDVTFYKLNITIDPNTKSISGSTEITFKVVEATQKIQLDLFDNYTINQITSNQIKLNYKREFNAIFIEFPEKLKVGSFQTVKVVYSGRPRQAPKPPWDGGFVWKKDKYGNWWCGVACEQLGASSWWPDKDHPSDEPDSALLTFTAPNGYDVISNGRLRSEKPVGKDETSHTWFVSNPINNYDITFYLGKFAHFSDTMTNAKGTYPLDYYVMPYNLENAKSTFAQVKDVLRFYEQAFGTYPFMSDKFSLVEAPYEGMEHQGAIAYGNNYAKNNQAYLDKKDDYIIVHETAHEWWGNSVTAADMADIWLQEGFATYSELLYLEHKYGYDEYLKQLANKETQIFNFWPVIQNYNVNENAFVSNDCYNKGAAILNNLRSCLNNDSLFFKILKDFAVKNEKKIVTTSDFIAMVNQYADKDYTVFFKKFLYDSNLPVLKYSYKKEGKDVIISFQWEDVGQGFEMPFCLFANDKCFRLNGTTETQSIVLTNTNTFRFYNQWLNTDKILHNGLTYFWTKCENH